jgi:hypothetical protein
MEILGDLIKITLPAGLVLLGMYLTAESLLRRNFEKSLVEIRSRATETLLPVRLQAYERMALFLERISPHNLILRVNQPGLTAAELQALMLREIREEFGHNLSQQVYMSEVVWTLIRNAMEDVLALINTSAQGLQAEAPSIDLARTIFETQMNKSGDSVQKALSELKKELAVFF